MYNLQENRACRVLVRLFPVLLILAVFCFASGCAKTETVRADPSVIRMQNAGERGTDTAGKGDRPKGSTGMEALGTSLKEKETADEDTSADAETGQSAEEEEQKKSQSAEGEEQKKSQAEEIQDREKDETLITFTAVGDNLINEVLYEQAAQRAADAGKKIKYDFAPCYAEIAPFIQEHDVNWIDIETLMTDTLEPSGYPAFSTPGDSGRALIDAGWNVFSLCSNHTYDQGAEGIRQTLAFWKTMQEKASPAGKDRDAEEKADADHKKKASDRPDDSGRAEGICCTGLWEYGTEYDIPILVCKGKKLAFLTYTYGTNDIETPADSPAHVVYLDEEGLMANQIGLAREQADAVIVSLHWGEEYKHDETEEQRALAQRAADMGADLIIGGHPHVVEGAEMLTASDGRKVFCTYSLGNFLCAQNSMPDPDAMIGLLLSCTFRFTDDGLSVEDHRLIPIISDYGEDYEDDHVVLYSDYSEEDALAHGMRTMYGFTEFNYDYIRNMLTEVVGTKYLELP